MAAVSSSAGGAAATSPAPCEPILVNVANAFSGEPLASLEVEAMSSVDQLGLALAKVSPLPWDSHYRFASEAGHMLERKMAVRELGEGREVHVAACVVANKWGFSPLEGAKSRRLMLKPHEQDPDTLSEAHKEGGGGGIALSAEPIPWREGKASFCVEILNMDGDGRGREGLEIGITDAHPKQGGRPRWVPHSGYAVLCEPSWVSSDAGNFWKDGSKDVGLPPWKDLKPVNLKQGDVVQFSLLEAGDIEVVVNGTLQVHWPAAATKAPKYPEEVYGLVGLRDPLRAVSLRLDPGRS
mmetsp:Transcript_29654/g.66813  ORF Transcript_29654/g.66813 Transcript_29654/m.66813 type:complete len:296 (-) Transcript_29654:134-1021(-)